MNIAFDSAYFVLTVPFVIVWLVIYIASKKTRKEQLIMSILLVPFGPLSELFYFRDYWLPQSIAPLHLFSIVIFPEDLIFAFCIAGIGAVIYEVFVSKKLRPIRVHGHIELLFIVLIAGLFSFFLWLLGVNSILSTSFACLVFAVLIVVQRHDLLMNSLLSGLGVMAIMFICYVILFHVVISNGNQILDSGWLLSGSRLDIRFLGVPLTELIWGFCWGTMAGPLYEFTRRLGYNKSQKSHI